MVVMAAHKMLGAIAASDFRHPSSAMGQRLLVMHDA